jgi:deazaflavin-dependent oxidoreductase (nitroreductase family)
VDMREINKGIIEEFRENNGKLSGPMEGAPILLLTTTGHGSGKAHTTPVGFVDADGRLAVAAANGGSDNHPDWYRNIQADNQVTIEIEGASIRSTAAFAVDDERRALLQILGETLPGMADHLSATSRDIPVVILGERDH